MTMTTQIPTCPTRRSFPQVYIFRCTIELWPRSHQQEATPCEMFTVFNQYQIKQDWICGNYTMLRMYLQSLDEAVQLVTQRARVVLLIRLKRLDVLSSINKDNFLLPLLNMKRLRGQTLSSLWLATVMYTIATCRFKFGNSNKKQTRYCHKDRRDLFSRFSQEANQALEYLRENLVTEVTSEVWRRDQQVYDLRPELSLQALH